MKISEAVAHYEHCFAPENRGGCCCYDKCPLYGALRIPIGDRNIETGEMVWKIEGCSLMSLLEKALKNKKPGVLIQE